MKLLVSPLALLSPALQLLQLCKRIRTFISRVGSPIISFLWLGFSYWNLITIFLFELHIYLQVVCTFVLGACLAQGQQQARRLAQQYQPQNANNNYPDEEEYQQPKQAAPQQQYQSRQDNSEPRVRSTTFIPIIRFDKEQGSDGSYKAA